MRNTRSVISIANVVSWMLLCASGVGTLRAETIFVEAETFAPSSPGWVAKSNDQSQRASRLKSLWGADGPADAVATKVVAVAEPGKYKIWVRYIQVNTWRGPFRVTATAAGKVVAAQTFDLQPDPKVEDWNYTWKSFDADLPRGEITLSLTKHEQKNCVGYVRHVDCLLLTKDDKLVPDHVPYGPQTFVRVTLGDGYDRPVYLHLFADHYRSPWYGHYAFGKNGLLEALQPPDDQMLKSGDTTPWCNLTPVVYQDSGVALNLSVRHSYREKATTLRAKLEFGHAARADQPVKVVKTFDIAATPNGVVIIVPPDLESPRNVALLKRDLEFAEETGKIADAFPWPTHGRRPVKIPYLVSANIGGYELPVDAAVTRREQQTLDNFGFNGGHERILGGLWFMHENSLCRPDVERMRDQVKHDVEQFRKSGHKVEDFAVCMLMDEPQGQSAAFAAQDKGYNEQFQAWLRKKGLEPKDLLVASWDEVRPVVETDRDKRPALHYYTQLFRTRALGDFLVTQRKIIEAAYGRTFPTLVNFSDGAVYQANFCSQGVDYFELLDDDGQNGIWGEDWSNNASTYECAAYNVALMQAAARRRGQTIGHYLIAHANRKPWDIKTKATSETARGVRIWMNFSYGVKWGSHEGGPTWNTNLWQAKPETWAANAEISREIGAAEDWLLTAKPARAEVAVLYSSASDIWTMWTNLAQGFDRMHTWLALVHSQTPVDIIPEREVATGGLDQYKVCYLSGPNITRAAATKLRAWVEAGGTLWLTAGAAERDEFDRPLDTLTSLLPATRDAVDAFGPYLYTGRTLYHLAPGETVTWNDQKLEVLSVKQALTAREGSTVLAKFSNGKPAVVSGKAGQGKVITLGFLPALSYIKSALKSRLPIEQQVADELHAAKLAAEQLATSNPDQPTATNATAALTAKKEQQPAAPGTDRELFERSYNPWNYPAGIRELLLTPVREAKLKPPLFCNTPLVDAVALPCSQGTLIALANQTLRPITRLSLQLNTTQTVERVESVRHGNITFEQPEPGKIAWTMPLEANDFVKVWVRLP